MKIILKVTNKVLTPFFLMGFLNAQKSDLSEIFFLDLGIVIEPSRGSETYNRLVTKPSKEVSFKSADVASSFEKFPPPTVGWSVAQSSLPSP